MLLTYQLVAFAATFILFFYLLLNPFIQYFRDPLRLRKFPSPNLFASLTPIWLIKTTWGQSRSKVLHENFQRLGDVTRVSPNQIIFSHPAAIKDIYGVLALSKGVAKDEFYDRLSDTPDLVLLRDRGVHSERRKAIANAFSAKTVVKMESIIRNTLGQLFDVIDRHVDGQQGDKDLKPLNLRQWFVKIQTMSSLAIHHWMVRARR